MTWNRSKFWHDYVSLYGFLRCEMAGWTQGREHGCSSGYEAHHIISRQMTMGNKKARHYTERKWWVFMASLCPYHHQLADNWDTRHFLLEKRVLNFGEAMVAKAVEELLTLMKSDVPELHRYLHPVPLTSPPGEEAV